MRGAERLHSPVNWFGGKGNMLAKLLPLIPEGGRPYCEPYAGGASVFFARQPAPVEVLNDLDGDLVNLFRVLQDKASFEELRHRLMWTPYARAEFARALEILESGEKDPILRAWAFFVRQNQGMSGMAVKSPGQWGRAFTSEGGMAETSNRWLMRLSMLDAFHWRLMMAQIDNRDALEVIRYWDTSEAVFYVDPPYHPDTRKKGRYTYETDSAHHAALVEVLLAVKGAVVLSGYAHPVYWPLETAGWKRFDFQTACHAAGRVRGSGLRGDGAALKKVPRVESVWLNPRAQELVGIKG